jgi:hypothetical protein
MSIISSLFEFVRCNWGSVASVLGLLLSVWVLVIAIKVKQATQQIAAMTRRKALAEELTETSASILQMGSWTRAQKWDVVSLKTEEAVSHCNIALTRWGDVLPEDAKNDLLTASQILATILELATKGSINRLSTSQRESVSQAQSDANTLISRVLGHARKIEERSS